MYLHNASDVITAYGMFLWLSCEGRWPLQAAVTVKWTRGGNMKLKYVNCYTLLYSRNKWATKKLILYYKKFTCFMYRYMYPYIRTCVNLCLCLYLYMNCWALGRSSRIEETEAVWRKERREPRCLLATLVMSGSPYHISQVCAFLRST